MLPDELFPTTALIVVGETTVKEVAGEPPKETDAALVKFSPVIVTTVPVPPIRGEKELTMGSEIKVKPGFDAVPAAVTKDTSPDLPPATIAEIDVEELTTNELALAPPN
jgi:hypothetical protein